MREDVSEEKAGMSPEKLIMRILLAAVLAPVLLIAVVCPVGPAMATPLREQDMVPPEPLVSGARALSSSVIEILLPETEYDIDNVADTGNYVVTSTDDQEFAGGVEPASVHHRFWPDNAWYNSSLSWDDPGDGKGDDICHINVIYRIYLRMPVSLTEGRTYTVTVNPEVVALGPFTFTFDSHLPNKVIHANQVAYVAGGPKVAYLSWWTGQGFPLLPEVSGAAVMTPWGESRHQPPSTSPRAPAGRTSTLTSACRTRAQPTRS